MNSTRICFIRHGETDWNVSKHIQGQTDIPLNETGQRQALAMTDNAAQHNFSAIYSRDLNRAQNTAQVLADRRGLNVQPLPLLRERHFGIFEGVTSAEGKEKYPEAHAYHHARDTHYNFETGESMLQLAERISTAVNHIARLHIGQTVAAVTHGGVLDILYRKATGRPLHTPRDFSVPNCALNWFRIESHENGENDWHLEAWDDHHYLANVLMDSIE